MKSILDLHSQINSEMGKSVEIKPPFSTMDKEMWCEYLHLLRKGKTRYM